VKYLFNPNPRNTFYYYYFYLKKGAPTHPIFLREGGTNSGQRGESFESVLLDHPLGNVLLREYPVKTSKLVNKSESLTLVLDIHKY